MHRKNRISIPQPCILYVDDELLSLKYFQQFVGAEFQVITCPSAEEAALIVKERHEEIGVVISDQRLKGTPGTVFLAHLRQTYPHIVRILATAFADINTAVSAINDGAIYQYVAKPWDPIKLLQSLRGGMEHFVLCAERERLLKEKASMSRQLIASDRLASYGALAEGINHHIRNALVPMQTYLQLVGGGDEQQSSFYGDYDKEFVQELHGEAKKQLRRITDMLGQLASVPATHQFAKDHAVSVHGLWLEVIDQFDVPLEDRNIHVSVTARESVPTVTCSRDKLSQVFRLILEDKLEHLQPANEIHIVLEHRLGKAGVAEHICMEVSDSGPDIEAARLDSVFTPFFVRQECPNYMGMHLATCHMTLHGLGGWAQAYNDEHRGTVMSLCLPTGADQSQQSASLQQTQTSPAHPSLALATAPLQ